MSQAPKVQTAKIGRQHVIIRLRQIWLGKNNFPAAFRKHLRHKLSCVEIAFQFTGKIYCTGLQPVTSVDGACWYRGLNPEDLDFMVVKIMADKFIMI